MATLGAMFKKIYGEALAPYGFKKIKGKQPYFVRVIGDEIVHVITYMTRPREREGYKQYMILGGVATVYRNNLCLDETPRENSVWLLDNSDIARRDGTIMDMKEKHEEWYKFSYKEGDDADLYNSLIYSVDIMEKLMLPVLNEVIDIKTGVDYFQNYNPSILGIYDDENFGRRYGNSDFNEGYLDLKVHSVETYREKKRMSFERERKNDLRLIECGGWGITKDEYEMRKQESWQRIEGKITVFEKLYNDKKEYIRIMEELERRKEVNVQRLRDYGFDL